MREINGVKLTDNNETHELYDYFVAKHGTDIWRPMCDTEDHGCGKTTGYIVEPDTTQNRKRMPFFPISTQPTTGYRGEETKSQIIQEFGRIFKKDDNFYIVITKCVACQAKKDGYLCGKYQPYDKIRQLNLEASPFTDDEKKEYARIFDIAFRKGESEATMEALGLIKDKSKYMPIGKK